MNVNAIVSQITGRPEFQELVASATGNRIDRVEQIVDGACSIGLVPDCTETNQIVSALTSHVLDLVHETLPKKYVPGRDEAPVDRVPEKPRQYRLKAKDLTLPDTRPKWMDKPFRYPKDKPTAIGSGRIRKSWSRAWDRGEV